MKDKNLYGNLVDATLNALPIMLWVCNDAGDFIFFNQKYLKFTGTSLYDEINGGWLKSIHPNDLNDYQKEFNSSINNKLPFLHECRLLNKDGTYRWVQIKAEPNFEDNIFCGFTAVCSDITKFKLVVNSHLRASHLLNETNSMAKVGGWEYDFFSQELTWTDEVYAIHEVDDDFIPNVKLAINFYHPEDIGKLNKAFSDLSVTGKPFDMELRIITSKNNLKWVHVQGKAIADNDEIVKLIGAIQDITINKENEILIKESEQKLRLILNGLPVAVYLTNANGYVSDYNNSVSDLWGQEPLIGIDRWCGPNILFDSNGVLIPENMRPMVRAVTENKTVVGEECMFKRADGSVVNFIAFVTPYYSSNGELQGAMNVMVDITDRKLIEERFTTLSHVAKKTSNAVIITDVNRNITWVNPSFTKITGYTSDEVIGKNPGSFLQFEKSDVRTIQKIRDALNNGHPVRVELINKSKNGNEFWIDMDIQPLIDLNGVVTGFIAVQSDITEMKYMHSALRKSENKLRAILDSTSDLNILIDKNCNIISFNKVASQVFKMLFDRTIGMGELIWNYPYSESMRADVAANIEDALCGKSNKIESEIVVEGFSLWAELNYFPVYDNSGELIGVALNAKDIDSRKRAELRVEKQNRRLLDIAIMQSHTLRRPIANVMGLCDLLTVEFSQTHINRTSVNEVLKLLQNAVFSTDMVIRNIVDATKDIED